MNAPEPRGLAWARARSDGWTRWIALAGFSFLMLTAALTCVDVLLRWLFSAPFEWLDDLSHLIFAVVVICCFPAVLMQGHNITIRFLGRAAGKRANHWLEVFGAVLTFAFFAMVAWQMIGMTDHLRTSNDLTMVARLETWPWWLVGTAIMVLCVPVQAVVLWGDFRRARRGRGPGGAVDIHAEGDDDDAQATTV